MTFAYIYTHTHTPNNVLLFCVNPSFHEIDADFNRIFINWYSWFNQHRLFCPHLPIQQTHQHSSIHSQHNQTQCAIVNHINKNTQYKQQMRALFMRQLTDTPCTHSHAYAHSARIHVRKGFIRLSPFKCEQSCTLAVSLYECSSSRHCRYAPLFKRWEISSFQWLLCSYSCVCTVHTFVWWTVGMCVGICIYVCVCAMVLQYAVSSCACLCQCLCCRDLFFALFTSLLLSLHFIFCFHFTSHSNECVYLSVHIRCFQCVRLIRFLVLVVQLN